MADRSEQPTLVNRELILAYLIPYFAYLGPGLLPESLLSPAGEYVVGILATAAARAWAGRRVPQIRR